MTCLKLRFASRPRVENLESRLQPGSVLTGPGYGWSFFADRLSILNQESLDSQSLVSPTASDTRQPTQASAAVDAHRNNLEIAIISVAAARSQSASLPDSILVDSLAVGFKADDLPSAFLTGNGHTVALAAAAIPTQGQFSPATPHGSVPQSPIGIAMPATPLAASRAPANLGNARLHAAPAQLTNLAAPTIHAAPSLQHTNDLRAVPLPVNNVAHFGGAGNQATLNFLSYLGSGTGPDSINDTVVVNEGGANFIYVSGSFTDTAGRTDPFAAKLVDGATSVVWATTLTSSTLPGPDVATGLAVNGTNVYLAITATDPASTPQTDGVLASLDAGTGGLNTTASLRNGTFAAVATDASGNVYAAGSLADPSTPNRFDVSFFKLSADLSSQSYGVFAAFPLAGNDASTAVTTGQDLVVDSQGNVDFGGIIETVGDPTGEVRGFFGQLNATATSIPWARSPINITPGTPGGAINAVALDPSGNIVLTGTFGDNATAGNPLNQDLLLGRFQPDGTRIDFLQWYVDPRDGSNNRTGDWQGNGLVVLSDGSSIVTGGAFDPSAGSNMGDPASKPTKGVDVHITHFVATDDNTTQNADGDPENVFGGTGTDIGLAVALDPTKATNVYVVGSTTSTDLPTTPGVVQPTTTSTKTTGFVGQASVA